MVAKRQLNEVLIHNMNHEDTESVDTSVLSWVNRTAVTFNKYNFKRIYNTQEKHRNNIN